MSVLTYEGSVVPVEPQQTVLAALEAAGVAIESSCRAGVCQTCLVQAVAGEIPPAAQVGLSAQAKAQGLLMACVCKPEGPLDVRPAGSARSRLEVRVAGMDMLSPSVARLRLTLDGAFETRPGQFVNLIADDGVIRSYSIARIEDGDLELHVRLYPDGRMSSRIAQARAGDRFALTGPQGGCVYADVAVEEPLVLAATGTGLAPLWGVLNDALRQGHAGPIRLYHGALDADGLYLTQELKALEAAHSNFTYRPCVRGDGADLLETLKAEETALDASAFFLCGDPSLMNRAKRALFLGGARLSAIRLDAFVPAAQPA